ncbi:recombinase family protein, partial [Desulforhopalus singaporensis]
MTENMPVVIQQQSVPQNSLFLDVTAFENSQRMAKTLAMSKLVPQAFRIDREEIKAIRKDLEENGITEEAQIKLYVDDYRNGKLADCIVALELAMRIGASPMAVLQNTYIVHGKPGYSATFIIAMINSCGRYSPLRFEFTGDGDERTCVAWAKELATGDRLDGPAVSISIAKKEGWFGKPKSKWQTMPELMLRYRAATFFGRMYAPELLMGMRSVEELRDIPDERQEQQPAKNVANDLNSRFSNAKKQEEAKPEPEKTKPAPKVKKEPETKQEPAPAPEKKIKLRLPANVKNLINGIAEISDLKTMELWMSGADEVINRELEHDDDKAEVRAFAEEHHAELTAAAAKGDQPADNDAVKKETAKIDKLKTPIEIDKWRHANAERIQSSYDEKTSDAILDHAAYVYDIL